MVLVATLTALIVTLTPWHPLPGATYQPVPMTAYFTPQQITRSEMFHDAVKWPAWLSIVAGIGMPVLLAGSPLGRRLTKLFLARRRRWPFQVAALAVAVLVLQRLAMLPFDARAHTVAMSYGLSTQSWSGWLLDVGKGTLITGALTTLALLGLVGLARRLPRWWFVPAGLLSAWLVVAASFAYPLVLEPMFNHFTPMAASPLRARLLSMAARDGVDVHQVLVADASRRTTALNAHVSGFGASRRLVVYDTLLKSATPAEVSVVVAHELGHAKHNDVLVGTLEGALAAALATTSLYLLLGTAWVRRSDGGAAAGDPAVVPVVLALAVLGGFVALPVQNTVSRSIEARADASALALTHDPATFIAVQQQLAVSNLDHLDPNPVLAFWFNTHPDALSRIEMALQWRQLHPRQAGRSRTSP